MPFINTRLNRSLAAKEGFPPENQKPRAAKQEEAWVLAIWGGCIKKDRPLLVLPKKERPILTISIIFAYIEYQYHLT